MHIFTIEDLQNALDIAKKSQDEEKDKGNEEWRDSFVELLKASELSGKAFETGHANKRNDVGNMKENQRTMGGDRKGLKVIYEQAVLHCKTGEYRKTIGRSRELLALAKKLGNKEGERRALEVMGFAYNSIGEYQKAIEYYEKHLEISEEIGDKRRLGKAQADMGVAYNNIGKHQKAMECHRKDLKISEELGDKRGISRAYGYMGNVHYNIREYQKATECHRKQLKIVEELGDKREMAKVHENMGNANNYIRKYQKAVDCHRKHLEIAKELGDKEGIGRAYVNMGNAYDSISEYQKAIDCYIKHLENAKEFGDKRKIGGVYGNMGSAYYNISKYQKAIDCYSNAVEIAKKLGDKRRIGRIYGNMGSAFTKISEYQKAIDCYRKDLEMAEELGDKAQTSRAYGNMGVVYKQIGEYQKAIDYHHQNLKIAEELGDKVEMGRAFGNIGIAYKNIGEYQESIDYFSKDLKIAEELGDKRGIGRAYGNMGISYKSMGEYQKSIDYYCKHLKIAGELGDKEGIGRANANMGLSYNYIGEHQKAIDCQRRHLEIAKELGDLHGVAIALSNLGISYQVRSDDKLACSFLAKSILSYQKIRRSAVYEDELNTSISNLFAKVHKTLLYTLLNLKQVKSALLVSDSGKAKALYDLTRKCVDIVTDPLLDEKFTNAIQAIADDPCLKTNEAFLDIALSRVICVMRDENIISYTFDSQHNLHIWVISGKRIFHKTWKAANGMSTKTHGEAISRGIEEYVTRNLPKNVPHNLEPAKVCSFDGNAKKNHLDLSFTGNKDDRENNFTRDLEERVENLTRSGETRLETINCDPKISLLESLEGRYNLDSSATNPHASSNSPQKSSEEHEKDAKKIVGRYSLERANITRSRVKNGTDCRGPPLGQNTFQTSLEKLYSIYISPIEEYLVGSKILVVPEGSLFKVPFCALLDSKKAHLCDRYSLQFAPALHVLNASLSKPSPKIGPALFVGNPIVGEVKFYGVFESIPELANAKVEAKECSKYFNAEPLLDENATKENVLKNMKDASVIHIAAHGHIDYADIFLAPNKGAPKPPSEEHYLLTAEDVVECTLQARLVVLSCCHSGRGRISAEGVVGIARSFLGAGARSVLVSLWRLLDAETMEFMKLFYEKVIQGVSVCVALQQAMIEMKKKYEMEAWSYFQIVGEDISLTKAEIEEIRRQSSTR